MASFPDPVWFLALGRLMEAEGEAFRRLGYAEVRFAIRVLNDEGEGIERTTGLEFEGYSIVRAEALTGTDAFDPDFVICARRRVWQRMLDEIARNGRPDLRGTLSSLALVGEELWLESSDQLREDKFYRVNQTLQEFFNLAARLRG
jgi:hypothetical protein